MTRRAKRATIRAPNLLRTATHTRPYWHTRTKLHDLPLASPILRYRSLFAPFDATTNNIAADIEENKMDLRNKDADGIRYETRSPWLEQTLHEQSKARTMRSGVLSAGHRFHAFPTFPPASPVLAAAIWCRLRASPKLFCPSKLSPRSPKILLVLVSYLRSIVGGCIALAEAYGVQVMSYNLLVHAMDNDPSDGVH